jgi:2-polyprenyl-3-methyl-5-hydroxy-6-metoxy-1,4-benzoquinol methylase
MALQDFSYRTSCPLCKSPCKLFFSRDLASISQALRIMEQKGFYDGVRYELYHCDQCNHYFQSFIPINVYEETFADEQSPVSLQKKVKTNLLWESTRALEAIQVFLHKPAHEIEILEFGSGWGFWLSTAKALGFPTTGIEVAIERIAYARAHGLTIFSDLQKLEKKKFDYIHVDQVLEHLEDPVKILQNLAHYLKPGGLLFVGVPNGDVFLRKYADNPTGIYKEVYPFEHVHCFTNQSLRILGNCAGLKPVRNSEIFRSLLGEVRLTRNLHFLQEALKLAHRQTSKTAMYFRLADPSVSSETY